MCDNKKPDSQCPVDGAATLDVGGAWRFHPHWAVGGEFALWAFKVRDSWRGQLTDPATDVTLTSFYLAPFMRWYWFGHGVTDAYLQGGVGYGALTGNAKNSSGTYSSTSSGLVYPFAIGAEWHISRLFRLGPQLLGYALISHQVCETTNGKKSCRDGGSNDNAVPWRFMLMGSFMFGER